MANRLLAYRVALEMEARGRLGRRRGRRLSAADMAERMLKYLVRAEPAHVQFASLDDYELATRAAVSVRQTRELYEEVGMGALVREIIDGLDGRGLVRVDRKSVSRGYQGIFPTEQARGMVDLRPWYRRALAFFDPPTEQPL